MEGGFCSTELVLPLGKISKEIWNEYNLKFPEKNPDQGLHII